MSQIEERKNDDDFVGGRKGHDDLCGPVHFVKTPADEANNKTAVQVTKREMYRRCIPRQEDGSPSTIKAPQCPKRIQQDT